MRTTFINTAFLVLFCGAVIVAIQGVITANGITGALASEDSLKPANLPLGILPEVEVVGDGGPVLLLLPCASCRWRQFDQFMERNKDHYRIYAVTLPGMGGTAVPDLPYYSGESLWRDNAVDAVINLIEEHDLNDIYLVGASYGAEIGIQVASRCADRVAALITLDSRIFLPDELFSEDRLEVAKKSRRENMEPLRLDYDGWARFNAGRGVRDPDRRRAYHGWFMATPHDVVFNYWYETILNRIKNNRSLEALKVPVLDIRAIHPWWDNVEERRQKIIDSIAGADLPKGYQLLFVYDSSHFISEYQPEALDNIIANYVAGRPVIDYVPD